MSTEIELNGNGEFYTNGKYKNGNGMPKNSSQIFGTPSPTESVSEWVKKFCTINSRDLNLQFMGIFKSDRLRIWGSMWKNNQTIISTVRLNYVIFMKITSAPSEAKKAKKL